MARFRPVHLWKIVGSLLLLFTNFDSHGNSGSVATYVFHITYESGSVTDGVSGITAASPSAKDAITIDCTIARRGRCSSRAKLRRSDEYMSFGNYRAETDSRHLKRSWYGQGDNFRYGFSLYLPENWERDNSRSIDIVWQFKHFADPADGFVAVKGNHIVLRLGPEEQFIVVRHYPSGRWIDFRIDVKWSEKQDGHVTVATRIEPQAEFVEVLRRNVRTLWGRPSSSGYLKWGLYKPGYGESDTHQPRIVFHDEIKVERLSVDSFK